MHQLDTLVLDHPTEVLDDPLAGRHRAAPPTARRALTRIAVGVVAFLLVAVLGWFTADAVGLTSAISTPAPDFPVGSLRPDGDEPSPARAADGPATPTSVAPPPPTTVDASGGSAAEAPAGSRATPESQTTAERPPVPSVKVGDSCRSPGAVGVTAKGKQAVCTSGGGPIRWKHA